MDVLVVDDMVSINYVSYICILYMYIYVYMYVCIYIYKYIYIYLHIYLSFSQKYFSVGRSRIKRLC